MISEHRSSPPTTGTGRTILLGLHTGWPGLLAVAVLAAALVTAIAGSIEALYPDLADRQQYAATVGDSPATRAFNGQGYGLTTTGGITAYEVGFMGQLLFPVLALHVALRHTRAEEEAGRTELLTAARVGRLAPLASAAVLLTLTALATGALMLTGMVGAGLSVAGSVWYCAGVVLLMHFFGTVGMLLGQLTQSARTAYLAGLSVTTLAYLTRAIVDGLGWNAPWAGPLAWAAEVRAFADPQLWPLVAYAVGSLALLTLAGLLALRRDLGAGVIAPRPGPPRGGPALGTVVGLAWRLTRAAFLTWAGLAVLWAACFGVLTEEVASLVDSNPALAQALGVEHGGDVVTSLALVVIALAATAVAVQGSGRLGAEESADRLGAVLATRVSCTRLWLGWWAVVAATSLAVLGLGALALGLASWAATGEQDSLTTALDAGLGYTVPVLFTAAVAAALRALSPRIAPAAWALVAWIGLVGFLAETLRIPERARDLSPLHLVGTLPQDEPSVAAILGLGAGAVLLLAVSVAAFRRRDLRAS
ncbi:ABC transporter permease [Brevibacterium aurantiacum]|uniref:ABC transporter permease n=1 Tax=Brevibacterium aurantiacum TaxID=273384 RepID=UPI0011432759|nr:ABC transporter [Brevibacterium aurantiacum]GEB24968.1 exporter of polyketide antibiotics [Brevibacterium aurantiacum]